MLCVIRLIILILIVVMLNVVMLSVVALLSVHQFRTSIEPNTEIIALLNEIRQNCSSISVLMSMSTLWFGVSKKAFINFLKTISLKAVKDINLSLRH